MDDIVKVLIEFNANIELKRKKGNTPLHLAIDHNNLSVAKLLIENNANINAQNYDLQTPLHLSAKFQNNNETIEYLLEKGADPHIIDKNEDPPLYVAIANNNAEAINIFMTKGFDINLVNTKNQSALHIAAISGCTDIVRRIIDYGVDIDLQDCYLNTALHYAAMYDFTDMVNTLLAHQATATIRNAKGKSALFYASPAAAKIFKQHFQNDAVLINIASERTQHYKRKPIIRKKVSSIPTPERPKPVPYQKPQQNTIALKYRMESSRSNSPQRHSPYDIKNTVYNRFSHEELNQSDLNITPNNNNQQNEIEKLRNDVENQIGQLKQTMNDQMSQMFLLINEIKNKLDHH